MTRVMSKMTAAATMSIWLKPSGREGTVSLHFEEEIPIAVPKYTVKPLATAALDIT